MDRMTRRGVLAGGAAIASAGGLVACGGGQGGDRIAVSFHNMAEPFFVVMRRELMAEAAPSADRVVGLMLEAVEPA